MKTVKRKTISTIYDILDQDWLRDKLSNEEYRFIEDGYFEIYKALIARIVKELDGMKTVDECLEAIKNIDK